MAFDPISDALDSALGAREPQVRRGPQEPPRHATGVPSANEIDLKLFPSRSVDPSRTAQNADESPATDILAAAGPVIRAGGYLHAKYLAEQTEATTEVPPEPVEPPSVRTRPEQVGGNTPLKTVGPERFDPAETAARLTQN